MGKCFDKIFKEMQDGFEKKGIVPVFIDPEEYKKEVFVKAQVKNVPVTGTKVRKNGNSVS